MKSGTYSSDHTSSPETSDPNELVTVSIGSSALTRIAEPRPVSNDYAVEKRAVTDLVLADVDLRRVSSEIGEALAGNIARNGLFHPLIVTKSNVLIAGFHRLWAVRKLGWSHVPVVVLHDADGWQAALVAIDENLIRRSLSVLERCERLRARKTIYNELYPETARPGARRQQSNSDNQRNNFANINRPCFAREVSVHLGTSERTIQQEVQIATSLSSDVKDLLWLTELANNKLMLLNLSRLPHDLQLGRAMEMLSNNPDDTAPTERHDDKTPPAKAPQSEGDQLRELIKLAIDVHETSPDLTPLLLAEVFAEAGAWLWRAQATFETLSGLCSQFMRQNSETPVGRVSSMNSLNLSRPSDADAVF